MSVDEEAAAILRRALGAGLSVIEKPMFGGLCFLLDGNMLCGVMGRKMGGGAMFRVGKEREHQALAVEGVRRFQGTGRPMGGFVVVDGEWLQDDALVDRLLGLALVNAASLPPKKKAG